MNKRFLTIKEILNSLKSEYPLQKLFKADALIFLDKFASETYKLYQIGKTDKQIHSEIKTWNYENN
jgi:hypothetical protein